MGFIFCIISQKGGVGKTTTALSMGLAFSGMKLSTLLIDADPQGGLIYAMNGRNADASKPKPGLYQVFCGLADIEEIARPADKPDLFIADCGIADTFKEFEAIEDAAQARGLFREAVQSAAAHYDMILIDCPPGLGLLSMSALISCDYVLIPIQCEPLSLRTLPPLIRHMIGIKQNENSHMELAGILLTMYDQSSPVSNAIKEQLCAYFDRNLIFQTVIPRDPGISELFSSCSGITETYQNLKPRSEGLQAYVDLAHEIDMKILKNRLSF